MAIDRELWMTTGFTRDTFRILPCPGCKTGFLSLDVTTLAEGETDASVQSVQSPDYEPEWIEGRFTCLLRCLVCSEAVAVAGTYSITPWGVNEDDRYRQTFTPSMLVGAPNIFVIPSEVPFVIAEEVRKAFGLFWFDVSVSANSIRVSAEKLVSHFGIPSETVNKKGETGTITLHSRIGMLKKQNPDVSEELHSALLAVKWLGNAGSHDAELTREDLLDAFEILERVFVGVFVHPGIARKAEEIGRNKGPLTR